MTDDADLNLWFEQKLKTLSVEKTALVTADAAPEEVIEKNAQIVDLIDARNAFAAKAALRREEKERAAKYAKIFPEACRLKEEKDKAFTVLERVIREYQTAEKNVQSAEMALSEHKGTKPRPETFPSKRAMASWEMRTQAYEKHRDEQKEILRQKKEAMGEARQEHQRLKDAFDLASFQCRHYGPRTPSAKPVPIAWTVPSSPPSRTTNSPV